MAQVRKDGNRIEKVFRTKKEALLWEAQMRRKPVSEWELKTATVCLIVWAQAYLDVARARCAPAVYQEKAFRVQALLPGNLAAPSSCPSQARPRVEIHRQTERVEIRLCRKQGPEKPGGSLVLGHEVHEPATAGTEPLPG